MRQSAVSVSAESRYWSAANGDAGAVSRPRRTGGSLPDRATAAIANVCGFDYVLLLGADAVPELPADRFRLLVRSGFAALYTISHCKEAP
jgi:hypothetical protein